MDIKDVTTDPNQAVDNGIAFLELAYPDYREKLKNGFRIASESLCPLALSTGMDFEATLYKLRMSFNWARHHGFFSYTPHFSLADLQKIWEEKLKD